MARSQRDSTSKSAAAGSAKKQSSNRAGQRPSRHGKSLLKNRPAKEQTPEISLNSLLEEAVRNQTFLKLVFSNPLAKSGSRVSKVTVREISLKGDLRFQWTERHQSQERHENLSLNGFLDLAKSSFGAIFGDAHLFTTEADLTVRWNQGQPPKIKRKAPTQQPKTHSEHNQEKQYLIPAGVPCPFLAEIGIMSSNGQVRASMYHKFRQINRYLEFVEDLTPHLPAEGPLRIIDFGCGKSYLTFALHYLLTRIHHRTVSITGLDVKQSVIEDCERIARKLSCDGLHFQVGRIEEFEPESHVHLAVSLHACDTATDDALAAALRWQCEAILAVPCCQHEICQMLTTRTLPGLTRFGLLKDRFATLVTDALRAQWLELNGYKTQVLEFIETEHTPKNVLLRAVRRQENSAADQANRRDEYDQLKKFMGLTDWHLERNMPASSDSN